MCTLCKVKLVVSQMQFNNNFTSKLESRGQSSTLDKHWPSILSQLSVSVSPGGKKVVVDLKVPQMYHVEQILDLLDL